MRKGLLFLCLCLSLSINLFGQSGTAGPLSWVLEDGTLTISGEGEMPYYLRNSPWQEYNSSIKTVDIKEGVTNIGAWAFYKCYNLTFITIPNSVINIREAAFGECYNLTSITLPESVTSIGTFAFAWCYNLTSITLPKSVTSIGYEAFDKCRNLTSITIPDGVTSIERRVFQSCLNLTFISIPESVTRIEQGAFTGCVGLTSISIPNGVTSIGFSAFQYCWGLTSITIPNSVTSIEDYAFSDCTSLLNVEVQWTKPLTISTSLFVSTNLNNVTLTVPIGTKALYEVANVWKDFGKIIEKGDDNSNSPCDNPLASGTTGELTWTFSCPDGTLTISGEGVMPDYDYERNSPWQENSSIKTVDIKEGVTSIGNWAFSLCRNLTSITIPESVTSIGNGAFVGCLGLTSITIPNSVTSIGYGLFSRCISLSSITIPHNVTNIGDYAFDGCLRLTSIVIPNSVKSIGDGPFRDCRFLSNVEVQWTNPITVSDDVFFGHIYNDTLTVPPGTKSLYESAAGWKDFGTIIEKQQGSAIASVNQKITTYITGNDLYLDTPVAEQVCVYSVSGNLLHQVQKQAGETQFSIGNTRRILIVKGSSGWVKKVY